MSHNSDERTKIDFSLAERILKALASRSRLEILDCIFRGVSNPGEIARELKRHRATVEKHLRMLLVSGLVEKVPSLTKAGQLTIRYRIRGESGRVLDSVQALLVR